MRYKSYLLGFICIVATSILFILFGDQRPAVQSILTETHKQLKNNIQTFKVSNLIIHFGVIACFLKGVETLSHLHILFDYSLSIFSCHHSKQLCCTVLGNYYVVTPSLLWLISLFDFLVLILYLTD